MLNAYTVISNNMIAFCLLLIIGITEHGYKELVSVKDAYQESETNWISNFSMPSCGGRAWLNCISQACYVEREDGGLVFGS
ncbi:MAG: hypothetical protein ACTS73_02325 [Arsenophonus sp. NEOnobi-MAG3]